MWNISFILIKASISKWRIEMAVLLRTGSSKNLHILKTQTQNVFITATARFPLVLVTHRASSHIFQFGSRFVATSIQTLYITS